MALKTELEYEDLFGDLITLLTGLNRDNNVRPMKQANGTRMAERIGSLLKGFTELSNFCTYHVKFGEQNEEPFTSENEDRVFSKRFLKVEYNFYGPNAANNALQFKQLHYTQKSFDELNKNNIVYSIARDNTLDMDQEFNSKWWTRRNIAINYLEDVEIEFPAAKVEEVLQTEVDIIVLDNQSFLDSFQSIDNRNDLVLYEFFSTVAGGVDESYLKLVFDVAGKSPSVETDEVIVQNTGVHTLLVNSKEFISAGTSAKLNATIDGTTHGLFEKNGIELGIFELIFNASQLNIGKIKFQWNSPDADDSITFRPVIVEGNWIGNKVSNSEKLRVINNIDYGNTI